MTMVEWKRVQICAQKAAQRVDFGQPILIYL